jgi:hypothetical protein
VTEEAVAIKRYKVLTGRDPHFPMFPPPRPAPAKAATAPAAPSSSAKKPSRFSVSDRQLLYKYSISATKNWQESVAETEAPDDLPETGSIFSGTKARGVSSDIRKEVKDFGRSWKVRPDAEKAFLRAGSNFFLDAKLLPASAVRSSDSESDQVHTLRSLHFARKKLSHKF